MLKHRLFFGSLMTALFTAVVLFDGWLDGGLTRSKADDASTQGTLLCILIVLFIVAAQLELSKLARAKNLKLFTGVSIVGSVLLGTFWYWVRFVSVPPATCLSLVLVFVLAGVFLHQYLRYGVTDVLGNCSVNCFSILYLGLLSSFVLAIRINGGLWPVLMFVFVVKCADIGAYAIGSLFGKHPFCPQISPGKTWEGMAGAAAAAIPVAIAFDASCDIMNGWLAVVFGLIFAFIGQLGDLVESMIKRDAEQKDSANRVPGFGGILDIIDSPLVAAPFAYLYFMLFANS